MNYAVEVNNFSFAYNGTEILHDISLSVEPGEYLSIIGPNGAGKSTLLKCLNRIVLGGHGNIRIFGRDVNSYEQKELGCLAAYLPQIREYSFTYTVYDFVMMGRYPHLKPFERESREDVRIVDELLALTELSDLKDRYIHTLSGGERQKVYLAASLAQQPKILLLDEPTTHLDPRHQVEIQETISRISAERKITVLHVTHELNHIVSWSHKVAAIKEGRILFAGTPEEVITEQKLQQVFDAPFFFLKHPKTNKAIVVPDNTHA